MQRLFVIQNIFREVFDDDTLVITAETGPGNIEGWDSVAQVKLVLAIEEEFGIHFSENEISSLRQVGQFITAIQRHQGQVA